MFAVCFTLRKWNFLGSSIFVCITQHSVSNTMNDLQNEKSGIKWNLIFNGLNTKRSCKNIWRIDFIPNFWLVTKVTSNYVYLLNLDEQTFENIATAAELYDSQIKNYIILHVLSKPSCNNIQRFGFYGIFNYLATLWKQHLHGTLTR